MLSIFFCKDQSAVGVKDLSIWSEKWRGFGQGGQEAYKQKAKDSSLVPLDERRMISNCLLKDLDCLSRSNQEEEVGHLRKLAQDHFNNLYSKAIDSVSKFTYAAVMSGKISIEGLPVILKPVRLPSHYGKDRLKEMLSVKEITVHVNDSHQTPRPPTRPTITYVQTNPLNEKPRPPTRPTITYVQTNPLNETTRPPTRPTITDVQTDPLNETTRPPTRPPITDVHTNPLNETPRPPTRPPITDVQTDPLNEKPRPPTRPTITDVPFSLCRNKKK
ncbi:hypothetical protein KP79_PYT09642 [Mizuhopecten yessoensis]|uniref:Uncharacterized protein n=1 Tax=Mizuhopecten yessoensis TaxID=6573 RepID=A0A210Q1V4_MIZYE|nr:hypothetical protein KP79_PYT09642 [Mizuhopecten yessoensis]